MTKTEGTAIYISGDEYKIIYNYGDLLVLQRNGCFTLYFEKRNILLPCGKMKICTRIVTEKDSSMIFMGVTFSISGYIPGECGTKNITTTVNDTQVTFNIEERSGKLIKVTY